MTRVKICGLTSLADALAAAEAGADALGFVLAPSPRQVRAIDVGVWRRQLPPMVTTVVVMVDATLEEAIASLAESDADALQLHGSESPSYCRHFATRVIKRIDVRPGDDRAAVEQRMHGYDVAALLLDPGTGSGRTFDWSLAEGLPGRLIVSGGLTPENVAGAVQRIRPYGVDVASGVERSPGVKDVEKVRAFVRAVRRADVDLDG